MTKTTATPFTVDVTKVLSTLKIPNVNVEALVASQRKNLEAVADANKLALEGVQAISRRQSEIVTEGVEEMSDAFAKLTAATTMEDRAAKQAEFAKTAYQTALANFWALGEMVTKSNSRTFGVINKRVADSFDEVRDIVSTKSESA